MAIQSVARALTILSLFSPDRPDLSLTEIAARLKLPKTTAHGLIRTLESNGFLVRDGNSRRYSLGLKIYELGVVMAGHLEINQKSGPTATGLADEAGLTCRVGLWSDRSVLVVLNALPGQAATLSYQFGPRMPAYCTALGKAILAHLPDNELEEYLEKTELIRRTENTITDPTRLRSELALTRRRGYSVGAREAVPNKAAVGAPLFSRDGVIGAISLASHPDRVLSPEQASLAEKVMAGAATISRLMGYYPELLTD